MIIKNVRLKNFLSFADEQTITFSDKLSVIVGPNDSGKTNLFRAMTLVSTIFSRNWRDLQYLKPYFHLANYSEPIEVEVEVQFTPKEIDYLTTFLFDASLLTTYDEGDSPPRQTKTQLLAKHGRKMFSEFLTDISLIARIENVQDYPVARMLRIKSRREQLWIHDYGSIRLTDARIGASQQETLPRILHENFVNSKKTDADYQPPALFDLILSVLKANPRLYVDIRGFDFRQNFSRIQQDLTKEEREKYQELYSFLAANKQESANLFDVIGVIYRGSIVRIANTRCLPAKQVLTDQTLSTPTSDYYHEVTGDMLPEILYRLKNSLDQDDHIILDEIRKNYKDIMDGADFDVILRPIKVKVPRTQLITTRFPQEPLHAYVSDTTINPLALKTGETEETQYELVISFLKDKFVFPVELAAAGMFEALYVLTTVIYSRMKVILLDEPASNLHPTLQKKVLDLIHNKTIAEHHNQVIMITHSPFLLESEERENIWRFSLASKGSIALRMVDALAKLQPHAMKQILKNLRNSEIRSILFSRGVVLVEGISDKFIVQAVDKHLSSEGKGADLGNNEWNVLEIDGKENLQYFIDLARILVIPYVAVVDYDALMKINGHIKQNNNTIRTSAVFVGLANILTKDEISNLKELEGRISSHNNKKDNAEFWYDNDVISALKEISLKHGVYALTNDLEGVLQNPATERESKPLKALEWINKITCEESIPQEFQELNTYLLARVKASSK